MNNVIDNLTVTPGVTPTTGIDDPLQKKAGDAADRAGEVTGDAAITTAVKTKFLADTHVSGLKIDVDTMNGVVTLTGNVQGRRRENPRHRDRPRDQRREVGDGSAEGRSLASLSDRPPSGVRAGRPAVSPPHSCPSLLSVRFRVLLFGRS